MSRTNEEVMEKGLPHKYYWSFNGDVGRLAEGNDLIVKLDDGNEGKVNVWTGVATKYKKIESLKNLVGKRIRVEDAWVFGALEPTYLTNTEVKVLEELKEEVV